MTSNKNRADLKPQVLDPLIVAGPFVAAYVIEAAGTRAAKARAGAQRR